MNAKEGSGGRRSLTPFGIAARKFRLDRGLRLKDMAEALGCSQPFLSAIETGAKPVPADMVSEIGRIYGAAPQELKSLKDAELMSSRTIQIDWSALNVEERREILAFLKGKGAFPVRRGRTVLGGAGHAPEPPDAGALSKEPSLGVCNEAWAGAAHGATAARGNREDQKGRKPETDESDGLKIGRYIISECARRGRPVNKYRANLLLYYVWVDHYRQTGSMLFSEEFTARLEGPIFPPLNYEYAAFAGLPVERVSEVGLGPKIKLSVDRALDKYINLSTDRLSEMAHRPGSPWDAVYKGGEGNRRPIPPAVIIAKEIMHESEASEPPGITKKETEGLLAAGEYGVDIDM